MRQDLYGLIRKAIIEKAQVVATYDGYGREMCPHVLGKKRGRAQALFYQFGGRSRSGLGPDGSSENWRCIFLDRLSDVSIRLGPWHTGSGHSRPQTCVDEIDVEVAY